MSAATDKPEGKNERWHIGKELPLAMIAGLAVQGVVFIWTASKFAAQVEQHDRRIVALEATDARMGEDARRISETLARMDERMQAQTAILRRVEDALRTPPPSR